MFNDTINRFYSKNVVSTHVNAVTGNITKTYLNSFFKRFHLASGYADNLLNPESHVYDGNMEYDKYEDGYYRAAVVVQMVVCGDMEVLAEIIWKTDYDKLFEDKGEE